MKRIMVVLPTVLMLGCTPHEPTQAMVDAIALGYQQIECADIDVSPVVGDVRPEQAVDRFCWAAREALRLARRSDLVESMALEVDSIVGAFVWMELVARSTVDTSDPDTAFAVVFDLPVRDHNVLVGGVGLDVEIAWVPKGLRY